MGAVPAATSDGPLWPWLVRSANTSDGLASSATTNGRTSAIHGLLLRANPRCTAAQAPAQAIRRNRTHVQVRLERLREGIRHTQSFECSRRDAFHAICSVCRNQSLQIVRGTRLFA